MNELVKQYRIFCQVVPVLLPNDHDFPHFMAWLENQILTSNNSSLQHQQSAAIANAQS